MTELNSPLFQVNRQRIDVPICLLLSVLFLSFGLFLPVITLKELIFFKSTFSVVSGIISLFQEEHYVLGVIIFFFSIVFPIFKLIVLSMVWFCRLEEYRRGFYLHWLGILGKWSMLDVFVVAVTIVITKISKLAKAEARIGLYFFAASIILAMIVTERIERLVRNRNSRSNPSDSSLASNCIKPEPGQDSPG